jgi:hypothetical protein
MVIVLAQIPLTRSCSWRVTSAKTFKIFVGIIGGNYAKGFGFCTRKVNGESKTRNMTDLCVISSEGTVGGLFKSLKSGKSFKFVAGDMVRLSLDLDNMELTVEGKEDQKCVFEVDELYDK